MEELRQRGSRRDPRWFLDEVCTRVDGGRHRSRRVVIEYEPVLYVLSQRHHGIEAAKVFLTHGKMTFQMHACRSIAQAQGDTPGAARFGQRGPPAGHLLCPVPPHLQAGTPIYTAKRTEPAGVRPAKTGESSSDMPGASTHCSRTSIHAGPEKALSSKRSERDLPLLQGHRGSDGPCPQPAMKA